MIREFEKRRELNQQLILENIGRPINSPMDDLGYYENVATKEGFFTSNRDGGKGDDDIYSFTIPDCEQEVEGIVRDEETDELIVGAKVTLLNAEGEALNQQIVGTDAAYKFEKLECEKEYLIRIEAEDYETVEERFTTPDKRQDLVINPKLEKDVKGIEEGTDLAQTLGIPIIYFDYDKFNIRYDAEIELQKVLAVMNQYPDMVVDIRSHTDCRAKADYNERLSENRAQSTRDYLISKGISAGRLTAKGYGESQLVNDCGCEPTNDSDCTEEQHQLNRRSEFIIVKM